MRQLRSLGLFAAVMTPGLAAAADLPARTAPPIFTAAPISTWEGLYAGTFIAGVNTRFEAHQVGSRSFSHGAFGTGILAGYNMQRGAYVFGLEGDIEENFGSASTVAGPGLVAVTAEPLHAVRLRGRLGYDLGAFLPFVAGGVTFADTAVTTSVGPLNQGATKTSTGFNLGAGVDWRTSLPILGDTVLRLEYLYDRLPSDDYRYDPALSSIGLRSSSHQIRAALISVNGPSTARPALETVDWSGGYAGVMGAYDSSKLRTHNAVGSQSFSADGGLGGLYGGQNFAFGSFVLGWEGATLLGSVTGDGLVPGTLDPHSYKEYFQSDLRGRVGYAFGRFLPFVAGGVAFTRSEQRDRVTLADKPKASSDAWTLGAGLDYMLMQNVSARVEYVHQKSWKDTDLDLNGPSMKQSRSADLVRAGLAWHFH